MGRGLRRAFRPDPCRLQKPEAHSQGLLRLVFTAHSRRERRVSDAVLLGDIGGTNARFALWRRGRLVGKRVFPTAAYPDPETIIAAYLNDAGEKPKRAILAAAGPKVGGRISLTNGRWIFDAKRLARRFGFREVGLLNDFEALALALPRLGPKDVHALTKAKPMQEAPRLVIGPGTGFGVAILLGNSQVVVSEGGHAALAPADRYQADVLGRIADETGRVSFERALSGSGLVRLYQAVGSEAGRPAPLATPADIVAAALPGDEPVAAAALELYCALLGQAAGDLALIAGARGGVHIAGGMVPRFVAFLEGSSFRESFIAKGRLRPYAAAIPIWIVTRPDPAFLGLARRA
ncbi:MAG: glucokinase [Alphaproteobacteria bacterium]|nr:glucokinase [Alphaproteobacteria bacterium]